MKARSIMLLLATLVVVFISACSNGVIIKGRIINAIDNVALSSIPLVITGIDELRTDDDGYFNIKGLEPMSDYDLIIQPEGYTSVSLHIRTQEKGQIVDANTFSVIPQPPSHGVFSYNQGNYERITEQVAIRYLLSYGEPGNDPNHIAQSGNGRLAAWYMNDQSISSTIKINQGTKLVVWQANGTNLNNYYNGIAPLYFQDKRIIGGSDCGTYEQAIVPAGFYLGLKDLVIGEYDRYCYAPLTYTIDKWTFDQLQSFTGQDFIIIPTDFEPGIYAFLASDMNWDPSSSYAVVNGVKPVITSPVATFELIQK
jgi:hypothetical protein